MCIYIYSDINSDINSDIYIYIYIWLQEALKCLIQKGFNKILTWEYKYMVTQVYV